MVRLGLGLGLLMSFNAPYESTVNLCNAIQVDYDFLEHQAFFLRLDACSAAATVLDSCFSERRILFRQVKEALVVLRECVAGGRLEAACQLPVPVNTSSDASCSNTHSVERIDLIGVISSVL